MSSPELSPCPPAAAAASLMKMEVHSDSARFEQEANFYVAVFEKDASFSGARFIASGDASDEFGDIGAQFQDAIFKGSLDLNSAEFEAEARFYRARFGDTLDLQQTSFEDQASFQEAEWQTPQRLFGPIRLDGELNLRRAAFNGDLLLEVEGGRVNFEDTRFGEALTIRARRTALTLEHLDLTRPALVALAPNFELGRDGDSPESAIDFRSDPDTDELPKILSLRDSNVLGLTIASADMRGCLFQGVRNVDRLSIEGYVPFSGAPRGRSRRRIVYEESAWRQARTRTARTALGRRLTARMRPSWRLARPVESGTEVDVRPDRLARIYRGLRKSLEESKDYAGASDFYYGEMEMRLRTDSTPIADRTILAVYWLLSGYGLRASRSLLALAVTLAVFSVLFKTVGFVDEASLLNGLLHSARSVALLPQGDEIDLTEAGQAFQIALRVIGPVLIGLTALALRSRIKR
jgi:Pentapeptide repeats (9 copies)